jgi:hypothetical protein
MRFAMVSAFLPPHSHSQTLIRILFLSDYLPWWFPLRAFFVVPTWSQKAKWVCHTATSWGHLDDTVQLNDEELSHLLARLGADYDATEQGSIASRL